MSQTVVMHMASLGMDHWHVPVRYIFSMLTQNGPELICTLLETLAPVLEQFIWRNQLSSEDELTGGNISRL